MKYLLNEVLNPAINHFAINPFFDTSLSTARKLPIKLGSFHFDDIDILFSVARAFILIEFPPCIFNSVLKLNPFLVQNYK